MTHLIARTRGGGVPGPDDDGTRSAKEVSMTITTDRPAWKRAVALFALAALLQACASSTISAQPQNPSVNAAAARG